MTEEDNEPDYSAINLLFMAEEAKRYAEAREQFLNPSLPFYASSFRAHFHARNQVFATAIVDLIASSTDGYPVSVVGCKAYYYGPTGTMELDNLLGFPALEAFERRHQGFIIAMAETDLKRRGFIVRDLKLYLGIMNDASDGEKLCKKDALAVCRCKYHGIFVKWDLGIWYLM